MKPWNKANYLKPTASVEVLELEPEKTEAEVYTCEICGKTSKTEQGIKVHKSRVHKEETNEEETKKP